MSPVLAPSSELALASRLTPLFDWRPSERLAAFGLTNVGLRRSGNEDAFLVDAELGLFAVADGLGGAPAGEVASRIAVDTLHARVKRSSGGDGEGVPFLVGAFEHANAGVWEAACQDRERDGMGTTLTALLVREREVVLAHVGDSRAYLLRGGRLVRCTEDHNLMGECLRAGFMTQEEAAFSGLGSMLTRVVGSDRDIPVDAGVVEIEPGDVFLLASDGLHGVLSDHEIEAVLLDEPDLVCAAGELILAALDRGGPDNVTVVLVQVCGSPDRSSCMTELDDCPSRAGVCPS